MAVPLIGFLVSGCASAPGSQEEPTVAVRDVSGVGTVLVDMDDSTLYVSEQERGGSVRCVGECVSVWPPLTIPGGTAPVAAEGVPGTVATIRRADGTTQVTYDGRPLYLYSLDTGPGIVRGDGITQSALTWHVATPDGTPAATT